MIATRSRITTLAAAVLACCAGGCWAAPVRTTPAASPEGVRISIGGVYCSSLSANDYNPGQLEARIEIDNPTGSLLRLDSDGVRFVARGSAQSPWLFRHVFDVPPRSKRSITLRVLSNHLHCDEELTFTFNPGLLLDGKPLAIGPLKLTPESGGLSL